MKRTVLAGIIILIVVVSALAIISSLNTKQASSVGTPSPVSSSTPNHGFEATPVPVYNLSFSVLNPQVTEVSGYNGFYNNVSQGLSLQVNMTFTSRTDQPIIIPVENLSVSYYNSTVNLHSWINSDDDYSSIQQQAFNYSFSLNQVTVQPNMSNSALLTINLAKNAPIGQYSLEINLGKPEVTIDNSNSIVPYSEVDGLEIIVTAAK
jgi:hypothetical protein